MPLDAREPGRHELHNAPWKQRPRRSLASVLNSSGWRLIVFPFIFAPLMIGKIASPLWGEPRPTWSDLLLLGASLLPWIFFGFWIRRPKG